MNQNARFKSVSFKILIHYELMKVLAIAFVFTVMHVQQSILLKSQVILR